MAADGGAQRGVGAVDLVGGDPRRGHLSGDCAGEQRTRQRGFGRETPFSGGDCGALAAIGILRPGLGQVQGAVDQGVPAWGGIAQIHRDLGVLDAPGGAGVLALHPDRMRPLFHVAGFIEDQDGVEVAEGVNNIVTQVVTDRVSVPFRPRQQMLQAVGGGIATVLGNRPAILAVQARDHPGHQLAGMAQWFVTGKTRRDPVDHRRELGPPRLRVYAMSRGGRGNFCCLHKHRMMSLSPPLPAQTRPNTNNHDLLLQY